MPAAGSSSNDGDHDYPAKGRNNTSHLSIEKCSFSFIKYSSKVVIGRTNFVIFEPVFFWNLPFLGSQAVNILSVNHLMSKLRNSQSLNLVFMRVSDVKTCKSRHEN